MQITLVAAVSRNGIIGRDGALPFRLPDDLARFKALTLGKTVVMGRKTFASIGRALPGRVNLVLTRTLEAVPGCTVVGSVEHALAAAGDIPELCVIGGEAVYAAFLPRADRLELTRVDADVEGDARFPSFDAGAFRVVADTSHPADARHAWPFRFVTYVR